MSTLVPALCGTAAVTLFEQLERRLYGTEPVYSAYSVAGRLLPPRRGQVALGRALRWSYGPLLGLVAQALLGPRRRPVGVEALAIARGVTGFERAAMPGPTRRRSLLFLHTLAFGLGIALARRLG